MLKTSEIGRMSSFVSGVITLTFLILLILAIIILGVYVLYLRYTRNNINTLMELIDNDYVKNIEKQLSYMNEQEKEENHWIAIKNTLKNKCNKRDLKYIIRTYTVLNKKGKISPNDKNIYEIALAVMNEKFQRAKRVN